jgi:hypothetical protein
MVECRSHAEGRLQKEVCRYYRMDGTPKEQEPYWYFRYHEGGKQKKLYFGKTHDPVGELERRRGSIHMCGLGALRTLLALILNVPVVFLPAFLLSDPGGLGTSYLWFCEIWIGYGLMAQVLLLLLEPVSHATQRRTKVGPELLRPGPWLGSIPP